MPAAVYRALFAEGAAYAFGQDRIGEFAYTTGYKGLRDARGRTVGAVAVPTLPEQASIEAGRARMVAYLFGALLVLLIVVFVLATLLADQVTRPFRRLRAGLRAVGAGEMDRPIPVETRDEMGALAEAFNAMQAQLAESRRRLAAQERELAWREMARQVAHEIKNPLMPMKLSVQHLRRLFRPPGEEAPPEAVRFASQFERTTTTLVEQMDALDRIAGAFSSYARLPRRAPETFDLNEVAREACSLFADEAARAAVGAAGARLDADLAQEPLPVRADREEIRRALINLLKNALQSLDGTRPGHVVLRTRGEPPPAGTEGPGRGVAEVQDNGRGIPRNVRSRVFQPNFSTKSSGTGLGLAIVQRDVEAAGGAVGFATSEGVGSTFTIRLPLVPVDTPVHGRN
jgi:nitrogen fixation/metabolism regulation signal transduction histidine kinase